MAQARLYTPQTLESLVDLYRRDPVKSLAMLINYGAAEAVHDLAEVTQKFAVSEDKARVLRVNIYGEFLAFYMHIMLRNLDNEIEPSETPNVARAIAPDVFDLAARKVVKYQNHDSEVNAKRKLIDVVNLAEETYATATSFAGTSSRDKSSTAFQFKQRVLALFGDIDTYTNFLEVEVPTSASYIAFLTAVDFKEWVKGPLEALGLKSYDQIRLFNDKK